MELQHALIIFDALSQETRLKAFRLLVEAGTAGLPAGQISQALATPHNTLSFHLQHLVNAGIVSVKKQGRSMIYSVNFDHMQALMTFMADNCCRQDITQSGCVVTTAEQCCDDNPIETRQK